MRRHDAGVWIGMFVDSVEVTVEVDRTRLYPLCKRLFDAVFSFIALLLFWPVLAIIFLVIKIESPGPAVYVHHRVGKDGTLLPLYKFRTMCQNADAMIQEFTPAQMQEWQQCYKLNSDPRVTRVGRVLRRTSMDELPQLINILRGELSFVGPRPITKEELEKYGDDRSKHLSVTPGLTGYWQAYARNACTYEERMSMELYYVDHATFGFDIRILFATVGAVVSGRGAM